MSENIKAIARIVAEAIVACRGSVNPWRVANGSNARKPCDAFIVESAHRRWAKSPLLVRPAGGGWWDYLSAYGRYYSIFDGTPLLQRAIESAGRSLKCGNAGVFLFIRKVSTCKTSTTGSLRRFMVFAALCPRLEPCRHAAPERPVDATFGPLSTPEMQSARPAVALARSRSSREGLDERWAAANEWAERFRECGERLLGETGPDFTQK
jgi:hypothetical protein